MMQTQHKETLDAHQPVVTITTAEVSALMPALLVAVASVTLKCDQLTVRGLTAAQVANSARAAKSRTSILSGSLVRPSSMKHVARSSVNSG